MSNPSYDPLHSANLLRALLGGYDDIQNMMHLMKGVELQLESAEIVAEEQYAIEETVKAARRLGDDLIQRIKAANELDIEAMIASARGAA